MGHVDPNRPIGQDKAAIRVLDIDEVGETIDHLAQHVEFRFVRTLLRAPGLRYDRIAAEENISGPREEYKRS